MSAAKHTPWQMRRAKGYSAKIFTISRAVGRKRETMFAGDS